MSKPGDVAAIMRLHDDGAAAMNAGDAAAIAARYTDDAIRMDPNQSAIIGKEAIQSQFQSGFEHRAISKFTFKDTSEVVEVEVAGDWAFVRGTATTTVTPKAGGEPREYRGKCLDILKRQPNGSWKFYRSIANSDQPLPGGGLRTSTSTGER